MADNVTLVPSSTPPDSSLTTPLISPAPCALAGAAALNAANSSAAATRRHRTSFTIARLPLGCHTDESLMPPWSGACDRTIHNRSPSERRTDLASDGSSDGIDGAARGGEEERRERRTHRAA